MTGVEEDQAGVAALDPVRDRAVQQAQLNPPAESPDPLLHQLANPFNHGDDPPRAEHDERDPIADADARGLAG